MPRNTSGTMSAPAGQPAVSGTTISSATFNTLVGDLTGELTDSLSRSGKGGMAAPLRGVDGTVAAPAISFVSEPASGLYRAAANDVRVAIGGVDAARWSANGIAFPVGAVTSDAQLTLGGALAAASTGADVTVFSKNVRTAGFLTAFQNGQGNNRLLLDYQGLLTLASQAAAIQPASIWMTITPNAGWTASNGLAYWKDPNGMVHVKGYLVAGTGVSPAFTLPAGFRPAALREWATHNNVHTANIFVQVDSTGTVSVASPTGPVDGYVDCVHFLAEA